MHSNALLNLLLLLARSQIQHTCLLARVAEAVVQHRDQQRLRSPISSGCGWEGLQTFQFQTDARHSLQTFRFQSKEQERSLKVLRASVCQR